MSYIKFNKMVAYEFSNLSQNEALVLSHVTVLDCKHCNDPFLPPMKSEMSVQKKEKSYILQ